MEKIMVDLYGRFKEINGLIATPKKVADVTLDEALEIERFFYDFENTNRLIDALERMAHQDIKALPEYGDKLRGLIDNFMSLDLSVWEKVDFDALTKREKITSFPDFSFFKITHLHLLVYALSRIVDALSIDLEKLSK